MRAYARRSSYVYIVLNLARGEVLIDWLQQKKRCTELEAAIMTHSLLQGVSYLHDNKIAHRDLKLENLMFGMPGDIQTLKILDFGFSKKLQGLEDILSTICGSPQYVAPEILSMSHNQGAGNNPMSYTFAVDCWSIGVILYMLLAGYAPFDEEDEMLMFRKILNSNYTFPAEPWDTISDEAKELVRSLITVDPLARMTARQSKN